MDNLPTEVLRNILVLDHLDHSVGLEDVSMRWREVVIDPSFTHDNRRNLCDAVEEIMVAAQWLRANCMT